MSTSPSSPSLSGRPAASLEALDELIAEVAKLQRAVVQELLDRRARLSRELADVDAELMELEEKPTPARKARAKAPTGTVRKLALADLLAELEAAPNHTLNIRKANLDVKHTKALAKANSEVLLLGGKGAWPTLTLVKAPEEKASSTHTSAAPQGMFAFGETPADAQKKID